MISISSSVNTIINLLLKRESFPSSSSVLFGDTSTITISPVPSDALSSNCSSTTDIGLLHQALKSWIPKTLAKAHMHKFHAYLVLLCCYCSFEMHPALERVLMGGNGKHDEVGLGKLKGIIKGFTQDEIQSLNESDKATKELQVDKECTHVLTQLVPVAKSLVQLLPLTQDITTHDGTNSLDISNQSTALLLKLREVMGIYLQEYSQPSWRSFTQFVSKYDHRLGIDQVSQSTHTCASLSINLADLDVMTNEQKDSSSIAPTQQDLRETEKKDSNADSPTQDQETSSTPISSSVKGKYFHMGTHSHSRIRNSKRKRVREDPDVQLPVKRAQWQEKIQVAEVKQDVERTCIYFARVRLVVPLSEVKQWKPQWAEQLEKHIRDKQNNLFFNSTAATSSNESDATLEEPEGLQME